ncbi:right-handed parallel beta-helix repeat-containing protein, partial [Methanobrevibacter sp.]|uniref:right-handed parallel beta-helix repeat-containing protein n=1 Tax=Methanobrevibacter sp. TaxID=66852 RepID=UPI0026DF57AC
FDNANDGDTFEFTSSEYRNISLVVDKKLNIVSKNNSTVYASNKLTDKAKSLEIDKTFGFYFTSKSAGSVLSGITIIASDCDCGVIVDNAKNVVIKDNNVVGAKNCILAKNSDSIIIYGNNISKATNNGLQINDVKNSLIRDNYISYNKLSGIKTSNIYYCNITNNTIHHNGLNGISTFNKSSHTEISRNTVSDNTNGIYINSTSTNDVVKTNSLTYNRKDPRSIMGGFETGNGFLLGSGFKSSGSTILKVEYNYLAHNEFYQAKNYWENENFELGQNWYDSNDPSNTFVCPRLLASLMNLDTLSVSNTLSLQLRDASGRAVNEFATFQTNVEVDGNRYTVTVRDGQATVVKDLDPTVDHDVQVEIGGQFYRYDYKASGEKGESSDSQTTQSSDGETGSKTETQNSQNSGTSDVNGNSDYQGNSNGGNSSGAHIANSQQSGNYGTNSSNIQSQDTSDNGEDALSNGDVNAGNTGNGESSQEGKAYEIVPPVTTSKELTNTSGLIVLCILSLMGCLIYGYRRRYDEDEF